MSVTELAERTGLAINTIRRAEGTNDQPPITQANINLLVSVFEGAGVSFVEPDEQGAGVRFFNPQPRSLTARRRL